MPEAESFSGENQALLSLISKLNEGVEWATIQSNALAVDIVSWGATSAAFWMYACIILGIFCLVVFLYTLIFRNEDSWCIVGTTCFFVMGVCVVSALCNGYTLLKIESSPRLYVTEQIVDMLNESRGGR